MCELKKCRACKEEKELSDFRKDSHKPGGLSAKCKECFKNNVPIKKQKVVREGFKTCSKCELEKEINAFYKHQDSRDGHTTICKSCKSTRKRPYNHNEINFFKRLETERCEYELIGKFNESDKRIKLLHKNCGKIWDVSRRSVFYRNCPFCNVNNKSNLSNNIERYLCENNICYLREYTFEDCKDKKKLPFDFAVFDCEELKFLIEADGIQHFKYSGMFTKNGFSDIQKRDNIKNEYCINNSIELIRISYLEETEVNVILKNYNFMSNCLCNNEVREHYPKSRITNTLAEEIKILYLKEGESISSVSKYFKMSSKPVANVLESKTFANIRLDLKEKIEEKLKTLRRKNRFFKSLSTDEIEICKEMKKQGCSNFKIAEFFNVDINSFSKFIEGWEEMNPNKIDYPACKVRHIETSKEFESMRKACKFFNLIYQTEQPKLKKGKSKIFEYVNKDSNLMSAKKGMITLKEF